MRDVNTQDLSTIEAGGLTEVGSYTIVADATMFNILLSNLYSDKPRAIVRELCTNARDSHAEAGILDRPFKITLPTRWDDAFSVRDYGISLTHEQVMHLYTVVGKSTKRDSNVSVGKFGLGAKVPFAYTDSFTITAILNGEKRIYNAFRSEGIPQMALLVTEPTDEETGLEISFSVRTDDVSAFTQAAKRVLLGFDVVPENNIDVTSSQFEVIISGADWKVVETSQWNVIHGAQVRQGCVLYPVDTGALFANGKLDDSIRRLVDANVIIDMPIGSVDITPSRESLSYDPATLANLQDKVRSIYQEVVDGLNAKVTHAKSLWDAITIRRELENNTNRAIFALIEDGGKLKWRGKAIPGSVYISDKRIATLRNHGVQIKQIHSDYKRKTKSLHSANRHNFETKDSLVFYYIKPGEGIPFLNNRLTTLHGRTSVSGVLTDFEPGGRQQLFLEAALGRPDEVTYLPVADVYFVKPEAYVKSAVGLRVLSGSAFETIGNLERITRDQAVYYVHTSSNVETTCGNETLRTVFSTLVNTNVISDNSVIIGIPASRKDIAKNPPEDWSDFWETARELVKMDFDADVAAREDGAATLRSRSLFLHASGWNKIFQEVGKSKAALDDSPFDTMATLLASKADKEGVRQQQLATTLRALFGAQAETMVKALDVDTMVENARKVGREINSRYPMLSALAEATSYSMHASASDIIGYVNMMDQKEEASRLDNLAWSGFSA